MRTSLLAFVALPVLVGGIVTTTAIAFVGTAEAPTPTQTLGKSTGDRASRALAAGSFPGPGDWTRPGTSAESSDKTEINGSRPHLTVVDGRAAVSPFSVIPTALSILPPPPIELPPLSDLGGELMWPESGGTPREWTAPGVGGFDDPGATDVRWTDSNSTALPGPVPPGTPPSGSPLTVVPEVPPQTDNGGVSQPGSGSQPPPTAGRPGRPPSDTINPPVPSDPVGRPGQDTGRPPPMTDPEPLPPGADLLVADEVVPDRDVSDTVDPGETAVRDLKLPVRDAEPLAPEETSHPASTADLDDSQPSVR